MNVSEILTWFGNSGRRRRLWLNVWLICSVMLIIHQWLSLFQLIKMPTPSPQPHYLLWLLLQILFNYLLFLETNLLFWIHSVSESFRGDYWNVEHSPFTAQVQVQLLTPVIPAKLKKYHPYFVYLNIIIKSSKVFLFFFRDFRNKNLEKPDICFLFSTPCFYMYIVRHWRSGSYLKNALVHLCLSADDKLDILDA